MTAPFWMHVVGAFLLGSIPTAYLVAKKTLNMDIRDHGSGNVGATNAFRVLGKKMGIVVFFCDFLKGVLPVILFRLSSEATGLADGSGVVLAVGLAAVFGHIFTPFLGFKGGKGVATGSGVFMAASPLLFISSALVFFVFFKVSRIVSLSSLMALLALFVLNLFLNTDRLAHGILFIYILLIGWSHRSNILRLIAGTEPQFVSKKKS